MVLTTVDIGSNASTKLDDDDDSVLEKDAAEDPAAFLHWVNMIVSLIMVVVVVATTKTTATTRMIGL